VESSPGLGTTFKILMPALAESELEKKPALAAAPVKSVYSILLVEDDEDLRLLTARILRIAGYSVVESATATEALTHRLDNFDLLVIDIFLPDILGVELAERLTAGKKWAKVIFTSAFVEKSETREILSKPENLFLQKPFTREDLLSKVSGALGKSQ